METVEWALPKELPNEAACAIARKEAHAPLSRVDWVGSMLAAASAADAGSSSSGVTEADVR